MLLDYIDEVMYDLLLAECWQLKKELDTITFQSLEYHRLAYSINSSAVAIAIQRCHIAHSAIQFIKI